MPKDYSDCFSGRPIAFFSIINDYPYVNIILAKKRDLLLYSLSESVELPCLANVVEVVVTFLGSVLNDIVINSSVQFIEYGH